MKKKVVNIILIILFLTSFVAGIRGLIPQDTPVTPNQQSQQK